MKRTPEIIKAVRSALSPQEKAWADYQMAWYQKYYDSINLIYRELYGLNLPHNMNYSPLSRDVDISIPENVLMYKDLSLPLRLGAKTVRSRAGDRTGCRSSLTATTYREDLELIGSRMVFAAGRLGLDAARATGVEMVAVCGGASRGHNLWSGHSPGSFSYSPIGAAAPKGSSALLQSSWPILNRLREMCRLDVLCPRQIGDRSRQLQHAVIRPRAEVHLPHRRAERLRRGGRSRPPGSGRAPG